jgi:hypothetical protein
MKYIIIGMHSSGKQEVADILEQMGISCGRLFTNMDCPSSKIYNGLNYELYTTRDVLEIFENNAYIFIQEFPEIESLYVSNNNTWYEGLTKYEFDNNEVFILSPDQLMAISPTSIKEDICFVWMDNPKQARLNRYYSEKRSYSFSARENIEKGDASSFVSLLYDFNKSKVLYFTNEEPCRIAAIIYSLIKHPDLLPVYTESFN